MQEHALVGDLAVIGLLAVATALGLHRLGMPATIGFLITGSVAGPPIGGATMELLEPHGLPIVIGAAFALYLPIPIWEYVKKRRRRRP